MLTFSEFPNPILADAGPVSARFSGLDITTFHEACRWVHQLPYGYNSNRDDMWTLFSEKMGSCTTKHAVVATLAEELGLSIGKVVVIYSMTEKLVTGTQRILSAHQLPYLPMIHCLLSYRDGFVDLTFGNRNGKNGPIEDILANFPVQPEISAKAEYLLYRQELTNTILNRREWQGIELAKVLKAREAGLRLLKDLIR